MTVRLPVAPDVIRWAVDRAGLEPEALDKSLKVTAWINGDASPTLKQLESFASRVGVPFGYLLLEQRPSIQLPVPDFRVGFTGSLREPSADLSAVLDLSLRRQDWYREYAEDGELDHVSVVGSASGWTPGETAADMRKRLHFEVKERTGTWSDTRKHLLRAFESLGGLTVASSMVANNTHRLLDPFEFRGFTLVDPIAPLIFINTNQTLNGQLFTLAHELAHVWRGVSGIGNEEPHVSATTEVEQWCNQTASEFFVPESDLGKRYSSVEHLPLHEMLDRLAATYRCGTLVVLLALQRDEVREFDDFAGVYDEEQRRLKELASEPSSSGGDHYNNQPFRVGERLSRAVIRDALEGQTTFSEALSLLSMRSMLNFDEYARRLGVA